MHNRASPDLGAWDPESFVADSESDGLAVEQRSSTIDPLHPSCFQGDEILLAQHQSAFRCSNSNVGDGLCQASVGQPSGPTQKRASPEQGAWDPTSFMEDSESDIDPSSGDAQNRASPELGAFMDCEADEPSRLEVEEPLHVHEPAVHRKRGRPVKYTDEKHRKRRQRERDIRNGIRQRKKSRGRPATRQDKKSAADRMSYTKKTQQKHLAALSAKYIVEGLQGDEEKLKDGQNLMLISLKHTPGETKLPIFQQALRENEALRKVGANVLGGIKSMGRAHRGAVVKLCCTNIRNPEQVRMIADTACVSAEYINRLLRKEDETKQTLEAKYVAVHGVPPPAGAVVVRTDGLWTEQMRRGVTRAKIHIIQAKVVERFFKEPQISAIYSGARTFSRECTLPMWRVKVEWRASYARLLRDHHRRDPDFYSDCLQKMEKKGRQLLTRFESAYVNAIKVSEVAKVDEEAEYQKLIEEGIEDYETRLTERRLKRLEHSINQIRKIKNEKEVSSSKGSGCLSMRAFWKVLRLANITFTCNVHPTECPIHDDIGPAIFIRCTVANRRVHECRDALKIIQDELVFRAVQRAAPGPDKSCSESSGPLAGKDTAALRKDESSAVEAHQSALYESRQLEVDKGKYIRHIEQFATARAVVKRIEERLIPGECLMYRDFVNQYTCTGSKMKNLVLVVKWRDVEDGELQGIKFNNFCADANTNSADAFYVADVYNFFFAPITSSGSETGDKLSRCKWFERHAIKKIYLAGDHGPHFSAAQAMYKESEIYETCGILFHVFFLCSYHAYNPCDAAGVESKRLALFATAARKGYYSSSLYADSLNLSNYHNSCGFDFPCINRGDDVFPANVSGKSLNLRIKNEVKYVFNDENGNICYEKGT